jgi:phenylacetate-CoA ligase
VSERPKKARKKASRPKTAPDRPRLASGIHSVRTPLLDRDGERMLERLREHPDAPRFNYVTGDRLHPEDLEPIARFREELASLRGPRGPEPPPWIVGRLAALRELVPFFRERIPRRLDLERDWTAIPTTSRRDLALAPWDFVPDDEPLDRLVIFRTAGTTGHPISVPHHPVAIRSYEPLIELALERHGARPALDARTVACFLVGAQVRTYTYAAVLYNWGGAGFAKINIRSGEWPREGSQARYFTDLEPRFLTGDPISFSEMLRLGLPARPSALVTTSVAMSPALRSRLEAAYGAPVIDWYSLVETGPIGYACPRGDAYHLLPQDIHLESLRPDGTPAAPGERGEIAVTGGRNVFFPLLRYRTGDYGRIDWAACPCGDPMPRLLDLEGRVPVLFRASDGTPVSTVDLSRLLREFPILLHEFEQRADLACELAVRPLPGAALDLAEIEASLRRLLGGVSLAIRLDPRLGDRSDGKAIPYRSELMVED